MTLQGKQQGNSKNPSPQVNQFITEVLAIEAESAQEAGQLAFAARAMVMATLPHSKLDELVFKRKNGYYALTMMANPQFGLPYGSLPRLLLAWMTTEAVRQKSPVLELGKTLSLFLKKLNLARQGGERGDITRLREQLLRLLTCHISCMYHDDAGGVCIGEQFNISRSFSLWWNPIKTHEGKLLPNSVITLASDFFNELIDRPIPIDFRVLQALRRSPLQIDIYIWLTYRFSFLRKLTQIPWPLLKMQFGANYADNVQGIRDFKFKFLRALKTVCFIYKEARIEVEKKYLNLLPSKTHIRAKKVLNVPVDIIVSVENYPR